MPYIDLGDAFMNFILKYRYTIFIVVVVQLLTAFVLGGESFRNAMLNIENKKITELKQDLKFYKEAWDSDWENKEYRYQFRKSHPNVVYYCGQTISYCPMAIDAPLAPCDNYDNKFPVWLSIEGKRFRRGYVERDKNPELFRNGKIIYLDDGAIVSIDTSSFRFEVY